MSAQNRNSHSFIVTTRLKGIVQPINDNHDVESLFKEFPNRMQAVVDNEGDRINK